VLEVPWSPRSSITTACCFSLVTRGPEDRVVELGFGALCSAHSTVLSKGVNEEQWSVRCRCSGVGYQGPLCARPVLVAPHGLSHWILL
jgi:hypothetical protein